MAYMTVYEFSYQFVVDFFYIWVELQTERNYELILYSLELRKRLHDKLKTKKKLHVNHIECSNLNTIRLLVHVYLFSK